MSLDAVFIALVWQQLFSFSAHIPLIAYERWALGLAVWIIYMLDRVADSLGMILPTARHLFYRQNRRAAVVAIAVALLSEGVICFHLPARTLQSGLMFAPVILLYFARVHLTPKAEQHLVPKEVAVAILFATGTVLVDIGTMSFEKLLLPAMLFAVLCLLNCSAIESRERQRFEWPDSQEQSKPIKWLASNVRPIAISVAVGACIGVCVGQNRQVYSCLVISSLAFTWFDKVHSRFSTDQARVLADLPLLFPRIAFISKHIAWIVMRWPPPTFSGNV